MDLEEYIARNPPGPPAGSSLWVGAPPTGGVVVYEMGITPVEDEFCRRMTTPEGRLASTFDNPAGGDQSVYWWVDGTRVAWPGPYSDPIWWDVSEAWLCRFGDKSDPSFDMPRNLALMTLLTGVFIEPEWMALAPKRLVDIPHGAD